MKMLQEKCSWPLLNGLFKISFIFDASFSLLPSSTTNFENLGKTNIHLQQQFLLMLTNFCSPIQLLVFSHLSWNLIQNKLISFVKYTLRWPHKHQIFHCLQTWMGGQRFQVSTRKRKAKSFKITAFLRFCVHQDCLKSKGICFVKFCRCLHAA